MCDDLATIEAGINVIPFAFKDAVTNYSKNTIKKIHDANFMNKQCEEEKESSEDSLTYDAFWEQVVDILKIAKKCQNRRSSEAHWNGEVHARMLRLALRGYWERKGITYTNVSSAKICDPSLLPKAVSGKPMQSKMVDYALLLDPLPSDSLHGQIRQKLRIETGNRGLSINHAFAEDIRFCPIAISIETKRSAIQEDAALVQLGTWCTAHFARLRQLSGDAFPLSILPLLLVQGHEWKMMIADMGSDYNILILRDLSIGTTNSVLGVYKIVAAVRRLA